MPEYISPQEGLHKEGHFPNTTTAMVELHRLLAIFLASKSFALLRTKPLGEGNDPISLIQEVEQEEITRILLFLAIVARVIDDREKAVLKILSSRCGALFTGEDFSNAENLLLRDACNRIIHAAKVRLDCDEVEGQMYFNPIIHLYGEFHPNKPWKAELDVIAFAKEYAAIVSNL